LYDEESSSGKMSLPKRRVTGEKKASLSAERRENEKTVGVVGERKEVVKRKEG
jgi:hypothetical protein